MALGGGDIGHGSGRDFEGRLWIATGMMVFITLAVLYRFYDLQIIRGEEFFNKGRKNIVQRVEVPHDRGIIYDRNGRIMVDNRASLDAQVTPAFLGSRDQAKATLTRLAPLVNLGPEELEAVITTVRSKRGNDRFVPVTVKRDLTPPQVEAVEAEKSLFLLDGVDIAQGRRRTYPLGRLAAHLLGYVNEIDPERLRDERGRKNPLNYERGDLLGRAGIEQRYEEALRGADGYGFVVVDAKGHRQSGALVQSLLGDNRGVPGTPGHNVFLTLDSELQEAAEQAFDGAAGSVIALDPRNGAVLAWVSLPEYDPNLVAGALGTEEQRRLDNDPLKPWLNRPIQGQYAPGSTFKIVTALAALAAKATSPSEKIHCPGFFKIGRHVWRCHKDSGHGRVDLRAALKVSCDTYFYTMGARIGIDAIADMSRRLNLGRPTRVRISGEKPGNVPDEAFHNRVDAATGGYQRGMAINTSIGQGSLLVTPLQLAVAYAAIANRGHVLTPQLVDRIESADFRVLRRVIEEVDSAEAVPPVIGESVAGAPPAILDKLAPDEPNPLNVAQEHLTLVHEGLVDVANAPGGTAYYRRSKLVSLAGKTGTAQVVRLGDDRLKPEEVDYFQRDHAWFAAYAPIENSEIVVSVLNEHSGHGGSHAAPIAVKVIDAYFTLQKQRAERAALAEPTRSHP